MKIRFYILIGLLAMASPASQAQRSDSGPTSHIEQAKKLMAKYDETPVVTPYG